MTTWEFDIEVRVRKTLHLGGPTNETAARMLMEKIMRGEMTPSHFIKWVDGPTAYRAVPAETWIDNDPRIVAVREIEV